MEEDEAAELSQSSLLFLLFLLFKEASVGF